MHAPMTTPTFSLSQSLAMNARNAMRAKWAGKAETRDSYELLAQFTGFIQPAQSTVPLRKRFPIHYDEKMGFEYIKVQTTGFRGTPE